jgi:catechol 2,3-dioxygenase-like lactoylglutathione lyase family enzyme
MAKQRSGEPFMAADAYGRSLRGMGVNLLVRDISRAVGFLTHVLGLRCIYSDPDFAVMAHGDSQWMLHADHSFGDHPLLALTGDGAMRGVGVELRLYEADPDACEARARAGGHEVLAACGDKPHGLRECVILDPDGYAWVPSRPAGPSA